MIDASVDASDVVRGLKKLGAVDAKEVLRELRKPFRRDQADHRKKQEGPDGSWVPRAASTVADIRRRAGGRRRARKLGRPRGKPIGRGRLLGRLPGALEVKIEGKNLIGRSRVPWSLAQFEGDRVGHGSVLPGREWLWISDDFLDRAVEAIEKRMPGWFG